MNHYILTFLAGFALSAFASYAALADTTTGKAIPKTYGAHHIGLAVKDLKVTSDFFIDALGFEKVSERPRYPAIFVTDGTVMVTLWQVSDEKTATAFDRKNNIGLHHLAFKLNSFEDLDTMYDRLKNWPGVTFEFAPEFVGGGPAKHTIFTEPGGIRLEFIVAPQ